MSNVRLREGVWEMQCPDCRPRSESWWELCEEFWYPRNLARCKACLREQKRIRDAKSDRKRDYIAQWRRDSARAIALYNRDYYQANRERILAQVAEYAERNAERIRAKRKLRYERKRAELLAQKKAYYAANSESIKAKARARYAERKAA